MIEDFLRGTECSLHALVERKQLSPAGIGARSQRALDGDQGPNTGGMGAFSPANNWNDKLQLQFETEIMQPLLRGLLQNGITFRGLLYPGLIITRDGARVLEFNCRFGDPETQALLPRMKSDLLPLLEATIDGNLGKCAIEWDTRAAVTVVLASGGYPGKYETGKTVSGLDDASKARRCPDFPRRNQTRQRRSQDCWRSRSRGDRGWINARSRTRTRIRGCLPHSFRKLPLPARHCSGCNQLREL